MSKLDIRAKDFEEMIKSNLAPVVAYLNDETVTEVLINGPNDVFIERGGKLHKTEAKFRSDKDLEVAVQSIANFVRRRINQEEPRLDARLPNGSRIHAVLSPCARNGTTVSIRKFSQVKVDFKKYIDWGALNLDAAKFLQICMMLGKNILVSGGTGSGKTTLLGLLCSCIPKGQRVLVIEDATELNIEYEHVVSFETKMPDELGKGGVTMFDLLKSSLRLRPDRIIVGEVRGAEGMELIQAMNTGHKGCLGTIHANTPADSLLRLEALAMGGDNKVSEKALRYSIASAIEIVVQISRLQDGSRRVTHITEVLGLDDNGHYKTADIFALNNPVRQADGKIKGLAETVGILPTFMHEIENNGIKFPRSKFFPNQGTTGGNRESA